MKVSIQGSKCKGYCSNCEKDVEGVIFTFSPDTVCEGKGVARDEDEALFSCGHTGKIKATSSITFVNDRRIALLGDKIVGVVEGEIIEGVESFESI